MAAASVMIAQTSEERDEFLQTLPRLTITEVPSGDHCPICLNPFAAILEQESSTPEERLGVTKLKCGHIFCIADITEWIHTSRGSCPTCRDLFLVIPEPSDDESSDGGEYIPESDSVADEMMDGETWTDEDLETWTDGDDISLDDGITEGESDSSWERSSEGVGSQMEETNVPTIRQLIRHPLDTAFITQPCEESSMTVPNDANCEQINTELMQSRTQIDHIQLSDWVTNKEETYSKIDHIFFTLQALKPRIDAIDRDTPAKLSFVQYGLATMHELHSELESKLEMINDVTERVQQL